MSANLVRKFLRSTGDVPEPVDALKAKSKSQKKKRKLNEKEKEAPATEQELLDWHVRSLLAVDSSIAARQSKAAGGDGKKNQKRRKPSKSNTCVVLGNTRGSAAQAGAVQEPTFNKKRHAQEKKERNLKQIAKLLKKVKKKGGF